MTHEERAFIDLAIAIWEDDYGPSERTQNLLISTARNILKSDDAQMEFACVWKQLEALDGFFFLPSIYFGGVTWHSLPNGRPDQSTIQQLFP